MLDYTRESRSAGVLPRPSNDSAGHVFVARQPIFDAARHVVGYELLFRSGLENYYRSLDGDKSTIEVIANSFFVMGFDDLTGGKKSFINFTRNLLVKGVPALLPPESVVIEILESVEPDETLLEACRKLKSQGYVLAMDDFVLKDRRSPLLELADIVKVDWAGTTAQERKVICRDLETRGLQVLAEKVESPQDFEEARCCGCAYFQGYFFSKPLVYRGREIPGNIVAYMQLIDEANRPELCYDKAEDLICQDIALTYKLLRFLNSAWFGLRCKVDSIRHALVLLGPVELRKWVSLISLKHVATNKPEELILNSVARARVCELMGSAVGMTRRRSELFLMGMFSHIDSLTDTPLGEALARLPLNDDIKRGVMAEPGPLTSILNTVKSYEQARWQEFSAHAADVPVDERVVPDMFSNSWKWAQSAFSTVA
jgi:EAL and modified HD-GYP domain-containing signal transduction protein